MKLNVLLLAAIAGTIVYILLLRRQLASAEMRGDMYREITSRLDRRVTELTAK